LKKAWGGISSLQFGLSVIWTEGQKRGASLNDVCRWMCENPARFLQLDDRKGHLAKGFDADFIVFATDGLFTIGESNIHHRHKVTPYDGRQLIGSVSRTYLRGEKVFYRGKFSPPCGRQILTKTQAGRKWEELSI
jgi:allantoinase